MRIYALALRTFIEKWIKKKTYVKAEQLLTISKERLVKCIGLLEKEVIFQVEEAGKIVLIVLELTY